VSALVSILLPCRNAEAFLKDCLVSLFDQSFPDFEIIAIDDGSVDQTAVILAHWARHDSRVRVLSPGRVGLVKALQCGSNAASGDFIARMDADDIAEPLRLQRQLDLLANKPELAACGTGVRYFPREHVRDGARAYEAWLNALHEPAHLARDIFVECPIAHPTLMMRRSVFQAVGGYQDRDWPEDYDLVLRLWAAGHHIANVPQQLLYWRDRPNRLSRSHPRYSLDAFRSCKVHYLKNTLLSNRAVAIWGAGPVGKAFARELRAQHVSITSFLDIDPRKIGQYVYDLPVWSAHRVAELEDSFIVAAVGSSQARSEIRQALLDAGKRELSDFCAVA
jgi:glycosyltransferase involved in cell wall biosynthesis